MAPRSTPTSHPGRYLAALGVLIVVMLVSALGGNILSPADWHKSFKVGRGLDLSSGTSITLQALTPKGQTPSQGEMTKAIQIMTNRVEATGLTGSQVVQQGPSEIVVSVPGAGAQKVATLVGETALLRFRQVLLEAPNETTAAPATTPTPTPTPSSSSTRPAANSPSASPSASGSASATPSSGSGQAVGASKLGASATPTPSSSASGSPKASGSPSPTATPTPTPTGSGKPVLSTTADGQGDASALTPATAKLFNELNCTKNWKQLIYHSTPSEWDNPNVQTVTCLKVPGTSVWYKYALDKAVVQGKDVYNVQAQDTNTGQGWIVSVNVKSPASTKLGTLTETMATKYYSSTTGATSALDLLGIVLDGQLQGTPPQVEGPFTTSFEITGGGNGGFSQSQATTLADVLKYGSLPLSFKNLYTSSVSASLGSDQLSAGLFAALVGLLLVVIYSFIYYRGLGVVSVLSLAIAAALSYLSVVLLSRYEGFTLSLAGIAGLIVAIGITADSFIVYFERLRDEVREGRSLRAAVERGWGRARRTILVSDTVSFLAALLLYILSEGDVRGFAFTLGLTTLIDVVVVFLFTKPMITLLARTKFYGQGHPMSGLDPTRLGARAPWRGGGPRPAVTGSTGAATAARTSTTTREA